MTPKKKLPICASTFELSNLGISWISISLSSVQTRVKLKAKEEPKAQGLQRFWMVKFRVVFSSPPKAKLIFELKASTWSVPHDCFIQAAVPNALHSPGLSYIYMTADQGLNSPLSQRPDLWDNSQGRWNHEVQHLVPNGEFWGIMADHGHHKSIETSVW